MGQTYDPSPSPVAVSELLSISPFLYEVIRGIELGGEAPFTNHHGIVPGRFVLRNRVEV